MGLFLYTLLFPGGDPDKCRAALERKIENPDHNIWPEKCRWHMYPKGPAVQLNDGAVGLDYAEPLSRRVNCPVLLGYIYDDDFWGYELWQKGGLLDQFASVHDYFDKDSPPNKPGDAELIARCFGVEPGRIARYLIPWPEEPGEEYAYGDDKAVTGDSWQMADFMEALGFDYDLLCPPEPEPEKEPNRPAPPPEPLPPSPPPRAKGKGRPADTPVLPNALTSRAYAFRRLEALGEGCQDLSPLLQYAKYQELLPRLSEAIDAGTEEAGFYLLRCFCWTQLESLSGRSRKWELNRDLEKALELEPDNIMALRGRSSLTTTSARYPRQIQDLTRLMELDTENRDLHQVSRAYFRHWLKDDEGARADLREVLDRGKLWTVDLVYLCKELALPGF